MNHEEVRARVIAKSPVLGEILQENGNDTLFEYYSRIRTKVPEEQYRSAPMLSVMTQMIGNLIDPQIAQDAIHELLEDYTVSTADHHGPLVHPFFVGSNIARSISLRESGRKFVYVFACGGVSLGNSSFPRGLMFHDSVGESKRVHLAPWRDRQHPVYSYPAYTKIPPRELSERVRSIYQDPSLKRFTYYADQVTHTNHALWSSLPGFQNMHLLYFQQEDVVNLLLSQYHFPKKTVISKLLTDQKYLSAYQQYFDGIKGAFRGNSRGTFLFWAIRKGKREALRLSEGELVNGDASYRLPLSEAAIIQAIERKEIFPSMALMFIVCAFYHGLTCLGGFSQVTYLGHMKDAYQMLMRAVGEDREANFARTVSSNILCGDLSFTYSKIGKRVVPATTIDITERADPETAEKLLKLVKECTLTDALDQSMPELHKIYYGVRTKAPRFTYATV